MLLIAKPSKEQQEIIKNHIKYPITADGCVGYDQFRQLNVAFQRWPDEQSVTFTFIQDVRNATCVLCEKGWEITTESMADQVRFHEQTVVHGRCYRGHNTVKERMRWYHMLVDLNVRFDYKDLPNGYGIQPHEFYHVPWFKIKLMDYPGKFLILGTRKRVWNMEVYGLSLDPSVSFTAEDVTKGYSSTPDGHMFSIHAWTEAKAKEYLTTFIELVKKSK